MNTLKPYVCTDKECPCQDMEKYKKENPDNFQDEPHIWDSNRDK